MIKLHVVVEAETSEDLTDALKDISDSCKGYCSGDQDITNTRDNHYKYKIKWSPLVEDIMCPRCDCDIELWRQNEKI
jgi:hypothetical protein